jgi:hypothetical protein
MSAPNAPKEPPGGWIEHTPATWSATSGMGRTGGARDPDELDALALAPLGKEIADYVQARIPPGTGFAVFLEQRETKRVIAITSNRAKMLPLVGSWVTEMIDQLRGRSTPKAITVGTPSHTVKK